MSEICRITVLWDPNLTTPNRTSRIHWGQMTKLKNRSKEAAKLGWLASGSPEAAGPVQVSMIVRRERVMDEDNIISGLKWVRDTLFNGRKNGYGVTPDDSPQHLRLGEIRQETGKRWVGAAEVVFIVTEAAP